MHVLTALCFGCNISVFTDTKMDTISISPDLLVFLKSLASESRLNILLLFLDGQERTVNQISEAIGLGQPATSEHLAVMKQAGVLISQKNGKEMYYCPDRAKVLKTLDTLNHLLRSCCE